MIIVNSIPKCGTNLLANILQTSIPRLKKGKTISKVFLIRDYELQLNYIKKKLCKKENQQLHKTHIPYNPKYALWLKNNNIKQLFIYRDPRDYVVSLYYYLLKQKGINLHSHLVINKSKDDALMTLIEGLNEGKNSFLFSIKKQKSFPGAHLMYKNFENYLEDEQTFSLSFEDIICYIENDSKELLYKIHNMFNFLGYKIPINKIRENILIGKKPKKSSTFRKGKPGNWKNELKTKHLDKMYKLFKNTEFKYFNFF